MKALPLLLLLLVIPLADVSASSKTDSLINVSKTQSDTLLACTYNELCFTLAYINTEDAKQYGFRALDLSQKLGYRKGEMKAFTRIGIVYDVASDFDSALWYYDKALVLATGSNDLKAQASALNNKAMVYSNRGLYHKAMVMYLNALRLFEKMKDTLGTANAMNNIAVLYNDMGYPKRSIVYSTQALKQYELLGNIKGMAAVYTNLALSYENSKVDSFYTYIRKSIGMKKLMNDRFGLGISYNDIGIYFNNHNKPDSAIFYGNKSIEIKRELNDEFGEASCLINVANAYQRKQNYLMQKACLDSAFNIALRLKSNRLLSRITYSLSSAYRSLNDYPSAYRYLRWHGEFRDSLINEENTNSLNELDAKYQSEKKDLIILNTNLALEASEAAIGRNRARITLLIAAFTLFILSIALVYVVYSNKQKRAKALQKIETEKMRNNAVIAAENEERKRIAKDLHDGVGQQLSAVKMNLSAYASRNETQDLNDVMTMLDDAVKEVRSVSHSMIPNALLHAGLASAVRDFMNKVSLSGQIKADLLITGIKERLDEKKETALYRIIQECVSNTIKHAAASKLTVQLIHHPDHLVLMIEDNGKGFDVSTVKHGLGIRNIESRVSYINGHIDIDSRPGNGTTITVEIPH